MFFHLSFTIKACPLGSSLWSFLPLFLLSVYSSAEFGETCAQAQIPHVLYLAVACWRERERQRLDHRMLEQDWMTLQLILVGPILQMGKGRPPRRWDGTWAF